MCLLCTLFEDLGCAIELHEILANEVTELHSLDPRNYLFNGQEEGDYLLGQGIINEARNDDTRSFTTVFNRRKLIIVPFMNVTWYSCTSDTIKHFTNLCLQCNG